MKPTKTLLCAAALTALTLTASAQSWLNNGLVAYYPFNGNANDESGKGDHGVVYGATLAPDRFGTPDRAYFFDPEFYDAIAASGTNLPIGLTPKTFSCWFRATTPYLQHGFLWSCGQTVGDGFLGGRLGFVNTNTTSLQVALRTSSYHKWFSSGVADGVWHQYVVVVTNNSLVSAYLDGQKITFQTSAPPGTQIDLAAGPYHIGYGLGQYFAGSLDEMRVYNRALSPDEVAQLHALESVQTAPRVDLVKAVKPSFSNLAAGTNYQLQVSAGLNIWTNHGTPFTATNTSMVYPQYWDVDNWGSLFFRLLAQ